MEEKRDTKSLTTEAQDRVKAILERGRDLAPSEARDELLRGIEMVRARVYVLNKTPYDELGKTVGFLLDILMDHLKSGALRFDRSQAGAMVGKGP